MADSSYNSSPRASISSLLSAFCTWSSVNPVSDVTEVKTDLQSIAVVLQAVGYKVRNDNYDNCSDDGKLSKIVISCGKSGQKCVLVKETDFCNCKEESDVYWEVTTSKSEQNLVECGSAKVPQLSANVTNFIKSFMLYLEIARNKDKLRHCEGTNGSERKSMSALDFKRKSEEIFETPARYKSLDSLTAICISPEPGLLIRSVNKEDTPATNTSKLAKRRGSLTNPSSKMEGFSGIENVSSNAEKILRSAQLAKKHLDDIIKSLEAPKPVVKTKLATSTSTVAKKALAVATKKASTTAATATTGPTGPMPAPEGVPRFLKPRAGKDKFAHIQSTIPRMCITTPVTKK